MEFSRDGIKSFDAAYMTIMLIGTGLAFFVASQWNNALQHAVNLWGADISDDKKRQEKKDFGHDLIVATIATLAAILIGFIMFNIYGAYDKARTKAALSKTLP